MLRPKSDLNYMGATQKYCFKVCVRQQLWLFTEWQLKQLHMQFECIPHNQQKEAHFKQDTWKFEYKALVLIHFH